MKLIISTEQSLSPSHSVVLEMGVQQSSLITQPNTTRTLAQRLVDGFANVRQPHLILSFQEKMMLDLSISPVFDAAHLPLVVSTNDPSVVIVRSNSVFVAEPKNNSSKVQPIFSSLWCYHFRADFFYSEQSFALISEKRLSDIKHLAAEILETCLTLADHDVSQAYIAECRMLGPIFRLRDCASQLLTGDMLTLNKAGWYTIIPTIIVKLRFSPGKRRVFLTGDYTNFRSNNLWLAPVIRSEFGQIIPTQANIILINDLTKYTYELGTVPIESRKFAPFTEYEIMPTWGVTFYSLTEEWDNTIHFNDWPVDSKSIRHNLEQIKVKLKFDDSSDLQFWEYHSTSIVDINSANLPTMVTVVENHLFYPVSCQPWSSTSSSLMLDGAHFVISQSGKQCSGLNFIAKATPFGNGLLKALRVTVVSSHKMFTHSRVEQSRRQFTSESHSEIEFSPEVSMESLKIGSYRTGRSAGSSIDTASWRDSDHTRKTELITLLYTWWFNSANFFNRQASTRSDTKAEKLKAVNANHKWLCDLFAEAETHQENIQTWEFTLQPIDRDNQRNTADPSSVGSLARPFNIMFKTPNSWEPVWAIVTLEGDIKNKAETSDVAVFAVIITQNPTDGTIETSSFPVMTTLDYESRFLSDYGFELELKIENLDKRLRKTFSSDVMTYQTLSSTLAKVAAVIKDLRIARSYQYDLA